MHATLDSTMVLDALRVVVDPDLRRDIVSLGFVKNLSIDGGRVSFTVELTTPACPVKDQLRDQATAAVRALPGVSDVSVQMSANVRSVSAPETGRTPLPGVKNVIAVGAGKGGVGKTTVAVNLALALTQCGSRAGILDADIYGPSVPRLLGLSGKPQLNEQKQIKPMQGYGLAVMSMGFLVDEGTPVIWRGPMVISALTQMLREVAWGGLDVLVVDMPPGTGDVQITMAQQVPLAGAVIVSTPQDLALIDARKGLAMFQQVSVPVLGFVENMSYFLCPACGARSDIFDHGGTHAEADRLGVPFLGEIPLHMEIREKSDLGTPIVATAPDSPHAVIYRTIAERCWAALEGGAGTKAAPRIVIE